MTQFLTVSQKNVVFFDSLASPSEASVSSEAFNYDTTSQALVNYFAATLLDAVPVPRSAQLAQ